MKEFLYISDAKVNMMFDQIAASRREVIALELGLNLKFLSAKLTRKSDTSNRIQKLELVLAELRRTRLIGRLDSDAHYFADSLKMSWGPVMGQPGVTFFGGQKGSLKLGLVGSSRHCLTAGPDEPWGGVSDGVFYSELLKEMVSEEGDSELNEALDKDAQYGRKLDSDADHRRKTGLAIAGYAIDSLKIKFDLEFVAVRKFTCDLKGKTIVLGTPIYVASSQ